MPSSGCSRLIFGWIHPVCIAFFWGEKKKKRVSCSDNKLRTTAKRLWRTLTRYMQCSVQNSTGEVVVLETSPFFSENYTLNFDTLILSNLYPYKILSESHGLWTWIFFFLNLIMSSVVLSNSSNTPYTIDSKSRRVQRKICNGRLP